MEIRSDSEIWQQPVSGATGCGNTRPRLPQRQHEDDDMASESVTKQLSDEDMDAMANFCPAIDDETMGRMEDGAQGIGVSRRLTLFAMARGADDLSRLSIEEPQVFGAMLADIETFRDHAKALHETADAAIFRMKIADCRGRNVELVPQSKEH